MINSIRFYVVRKAAIKNGHDEFILAVIGAMSLIALNGSNLAPSLMINQVLRQRAVLMTLSRKLYEK